MIMVLFQKKIYNFVWIEFPSALDLNMQKAINHIEIGELREAFSVALIYYDKTYTYQKEIHPLGKKIQIECTSKNNSQIAKYLFELSNGK